MFVYTEIVVPNTEFLCVLQRDVTSRLQGTKEEKDAIPLLSYKIRDFENRNVKVFSGNPDMHYSKAI